MKVRCAVVELLKSEPEWRRFFKQCCETSPLRLRSQAWQWRDELLARGEVFALPNIEDALMGLARNFLPKTPAAEWDTGWADMLTGYALARMQEHYARLSATDKDALDLSFQDPYEEAMYVASEENDPAAFREALKEWERVGLEALDKVRGIDDEVFGKSGVI